MEKEIINVETSWAENNFCCGLYLPEINGTILQTADTLSGLKEGFAEALRTHIEACIEDGDNVPEYLVKGDYELNFVLDVRALLKDAENYTTLAAISKASGINSRQLSHYAAGKKKPRPDKREKIIDGIHCIGNRALAVH